MATDPTFAGLVDALDTPDKLRGERSKVGQRGKTAERYVHERLEKLSLNAGMAFYRLPDFRAGSMQPTLADFLFFHEGLTTVIEVKEVDHAYRLPYKNFDPAQVGRMRVLQLAGVKAVVLVYHTPIKLWRGIGVDFFITRTTKAGSWDLSGIPTNKLEELL